VERTRSQAPTICAGSLHVSDLVAAHSDALAYRRDGALMYCGYGRGFSVLEVIDTSDDRAIQLNPIPLDGQQKVQFVLPKIAFLQLIVAITFSSIVSKMAPLCSPDGLRRLRSNVRRTIGPVR